MLIEQNVSQLARDRLHSFVGLLNQWRNVTNLISEQAFGEVWTRHIVDSVCLRQVCADKFQWLDFGSGAGFPGIVLGILLAEEASAQVHCVESDSRKCAFLRYTVEQLEIPVKIHNMRAENISLKDTGAVEVITARAFSSINKIVQLSECYLRAGAFLLLPRGKTSAQNVEGPIANSYTTVIHDNPLSGGGVFLQIQLKTGWRQ